MNEKICDIVICVWNNKQTTKECIESIYKNTQYPYRLVLIDNASGEETRIYLEDLKNDPQFNVILIRNEENLGNTKAVNQGLTATDAPYVVNLDNDTYVTEGWLTEMVKVAESDSQIGMVASAGRGGFPPESNSINDIEEVAKKVALRCGQVMEMATADCYCILIKREVIKKVGLWDEIFSPGYFDDTDYCRRTTQAGFKIAAALGAYVYHKEGSSFKKKNPRKEELFSRNEKTFLKRYGSPQRLLYIIDEARNGQLEEIKESAYQMAQKANWVWVLRKQSLPSPQLVVHSHIKQFGLSDFCFSLRAVARVLLRQKKKFDRIYVTNKKLKNKLELCQWLHKAHVEIIGGA